jgi:hypothetical protein
VNWGAELGRFAEHAGVAAAIVALLLGPARPWVAALVAKIGAAGRRRTLFVALALTLATRLALATAIHPAYETDVREYCEKAAAIARDGNPRAQETKPDGTVFYRTLGYSLPLAGWYRVTGMPETPEYRIRSAQAFNLVAACGIVALILALGRAIGRETAGRVAAYAYAVFLPAGIFALLPYTETWATLLLLASFLALEKMRRATPGAAVALGAGAGLTTGLLLITRTEFVWMLPLAAVWLLRERGKAALAPLAAAALLVAVPFAVNHQMRDGYPGGLRTSVQGGLILYFGNNPIEVTGYGNATPEVVAHVRDLYAKDATGGLAAREAMDWMKAHPLLAIANAPKKLYHLWLAEPQGFTWHVGAGREGGTDRTLADVLRHAAWVQALVLLALGVVALVRATGGTRFWLVAIALHSATWCVLASSARNRYPLEPLLLIAAVAWFEAPRKSG